ncbi:DoxX family protein [Microvirga sp. ACRRW]|uniref:DoxX family protein n=1 Tax=Microvirga sp. ACRRW TaxID=2918205 RepID=UPI001EF4683A|nr:DoxX family protein [Microvirga sp. ACRRW]MCG7392431.1 DoxX family protein [Microvirga sp. ACRRW]
MTPRWVEAILSSRITEIAARVLFTFPFWGSGLAKLLDFSGGMAEMSHFGLEPAWLFNSLTIFVQLTGSALIIFNRGTWFGAAMLGVFTFLTIPIVHAFWRLEGERAITAFHTAGEHMGMIGALVLVSILAARSKEASSRNRQEAALETAGILRR